MTTPPLAPDELFGSADERGILSTFLDMYRGIVTRKLDGLDAAQLSRRLVPSETTLGGIIKHLTAVEDEWFSGVLRRADVPPAADDGWELGPDDSSSGLISRYQAACERSRQVAASLALDDTVPHPRLGRVSLRWVYVHMIEETSRHTGHADILREQTDGTVGFD